MDDLINRKICYAMLSEYFYHKTDKQHKALWDALSRVPSAQQERKKGKWIPVTNTRLVECECGFITDRLSDYNFCPNCGADMRGEDV